jgi:hypothetical protein
MVNSGKLIFVRISAIAILQLTFALLGCNVNNTDQKKIAEDTLKRVDTTNPTIEYFDSTTSVVLENGIWVKYFSVNKSRTYFHDSPSISSKRQDYLLNGENAHGLYKAGIFVYIKSDDPRKTGWILAQDLEEMKFSPPKIAND